MQICQINHPCYYKMGFKFYDYDNNGSIGSVDIMNFIKFLDYPKILKIEDKYKQIQ